MKLKLGPKLVGMTLAISLIPLGTVGWLSYSKGRSGIQSNALEKLVAIRDIKKRQITNFFKERMGDATVLAANPHTVQALKDLKAALEDGGGVHGGRFKGHGNHKFDAPESYLRVHDNYYPTFKTFMDRYSYYDVFLITPDQGDIIFTVLKESDFGTRVTALDSGSLRTVWEKASRQGSVALGKMLSYKPSEGVPAQFVAAPIVENKQTIGVLVLQISNEAINTIMGENSGLGKTGETYLVGEDKLLRSDSRFSEETMILKKSIDTKSVAAALAGKDDCWVLPDYRGIPVYSCYTAVAVGDSRWALLSEIDQEEVDQVTKDLASTVIWAALGFGLLVTLLALLFARSISQPIDKMANVAMAIAHGDVNQDVKTRRSDEIGDLAAAFGEMMRMQKEIASAVDSVSNGDLSVEVRPRSELDVLGVALNRMITNLRSSIAESTKLVNNIKQLPAPVVEIDTSMTVAFINQAGADLVGLTPETCIGKKCFELFNTEHCNTDSCACKQAMKGATKVTAETRAHPQGCKGIPIAYTGVPIRNSAGEITGALEFVTDLSSIYSVVDRLRGVSSTVNSSSEELSAQAVSMASTAEQMTTQATTVTAAAEQMSGGVTSVAAAIEEMNTSLGEVSQNCAQAATMTEEAATSTLAANELMDHLRSAATEIGNITHVINDIADQTNLLALNATIEAAGAAEAGRGFAVVANEVKELARQTTQATGQINTRIENMQNKTEEAARAIQKITATIAEINTTTAAIASTVEEQTATTGEIAQNVAQTSQGADQVSGTIKDVQATAATTSTAAVGVTSASKELAGLSSQLDNIVGEFQL